MQIHHTKQSLQELFHEKSLCNSTGLCIDHHRLQDEIEIIVENRASMDVRELEKENFLFQLKTNKDVLGIKQKTIKHG